MAAITLHCPECGRQYRVSSETAQRRLRCKQCDSPLTTAALQTEPDENIDNDIDNDDEF